MVRHPRFRMVISDTELRIYALAVLQDLHRVDRRFHPIRTIYNFPPYALPRGWKYNSRGWERKAIGLHHNILGDLYAAPPAKRGRQ